MGQLGPVHTMAKRHPSLIPLSHDHHHGLALALRCRKHALGQLNPGNFRSLEDCAQEVSRFLADALLPHFEAEEKVLFTALSRHPECRPVIAQLENEHSALRAADAGSMELRKFLFDFGDLLERHIRLEERELFPLFEKLVPHDEAEQVGVAIERTLEGAKGRAGQ